MSNTDVSIIGRCCIEPFRYKVVFNAQPYGQYAVLLCDKHVHCAPYDKHIVQIVKVVESS